ncbi:MAG: hypothetical protein R6W91_08075, partial [Thermoplasmata archaeon]
MGECLDPDVLLPLVDAFKFDALYPGTVDDALDRAFQVFRVGIFDIEAVVAANNIKPDNKVIYGDGNEGYTPESTGIAFS